MKNLDLTNQRFGKLVAIVIAKKTRQNYWLCRCDCGNNTVIDVRSLRSGNTKSCGCLRRRYQSESMIGRMFSNLEVTGRAETIGKRAYWNCRCKCGKYVTAMGKGLRKGDITSCGCLRKARCKVMCRRLPSGESSFNQIFINYKRQARIRNYEFKLTKQQFRQLTKQPCFYCGTEPSQVHQGGPTKRLNGPYIYSGVDRQNNHLGYSVENCVACCGRCNNMKKQKSVDEFLQTCCAIAETQKKRVEELLRLSLPKLVTG